MTVSNRSYGKWQSAPSTAGNVKDYLWNGMRVWREFEGQWWLTGDMLGDDLGPFGSSIKAKDWARHLVDVGLVALATQH